MSSLFPTFLFETGSLMVPGACCLLFRLDHLVREHQEGLLPLPPQHRHFKRTPACLNLMWMLGLDSGPGAFPAGTSPWSHLSSPCTSQFEREYRQFTFQSTPRVPTDREEAVTLYHPRSHHPGDFVFVGDVFTQNRAMHSLCSPVLFLWEGHISQPIRR